MGGWWLWDREEGGYGRNRVNVHLYTVLERAPSICNCWRITSTCLSKRPGAWAVVHIFSWSLRVLLRVNGAYRCTKCVEQGCDGVCECDSCGCEHHPLPDPATCVCLLHSLLS